MQQEQGVWNVAFMYVSGSEKMQSLYNSPFYAYRKNINNMGKSFKKKVNAWKVLGEDFCEKYGISDDAGIKNICRNETYKLT